MKTRQWRLSRREKPGSEDSREKRRERRAPPRRSLCRGWKPRPTRPGRLRGTSVRVLSFVVMCPRVGVAQGGVGCQGVVGVVVLR